MEKDEYFASEVWLITGLFNSLPGILTLKAGRLIFTALGTGTYWDSGLNKLEKKSGVANFAALLKQNKSVDMFNVEVSEIQKVTFPFIYFSGGAHITLNNKKYRLSFIQPNNTVMPVLDSKSYKAVYSREVEIIQDIKHARNVGKKWKTLLNSA